MTEITDSKFFDFEGSFANLFTEKPKPQPPVRAVNNEQYLLQALIAAGEAAYHWDISSDTIVWSANVGEVLGCRPESIRTGRHFASMLDPENLTTRYETVVHSKERDLGDGVSFQIEYAFHSPAHQNGDLIHLEDNGHWQAGDDGAPKVVYGTLKRIDARHSREQQLSILGTSDPLTGMMNRGRMTDALNHTINSTQKTGGSCAFALAVINNLNLVNDAYGFDIADEVVVQVGHRLKQVMRMGDNIARYSSGKFGIILRECSEAELHTALARFTSAIRESAIGTTKGPVWATISIGAVSLPQNADTATLAIFNAEEALSDARREVGDGYLIYQTSVGREAHHEFNSRCATQLMKYLREESLRLAYQPIVDAQTGQPTKYEALLRLPEAEGQDPLSAAEITSLAERLGLAHLIDRAVLQLIIHALHENSDLRLSMNVSSTTIGDGVWQDQFMSELNSNKDVTNRLTIELNENATLSNLNAARRFIEGLRAAGTAVAIDHFGQGYSSIRNLRELPVNQLKLDGTLCKDISNHPENKTLVRSLLEMAAHADIKTVATWIESKEDAEVLTQLGANYLQGNHFGQPSLDQQWAIENLKAVIETPALQPEEPSVEITADVPETIIEVKRAQPVSEFDAPLDFSAVDDSIAKLREALEGLSANSTAATSEEKSEDAA